MDHAPALGPTFPPAALPLDDDAELTKLHPNYTHALRVRTTLTAIPFLIGSLVLEAICCRRG
jgi:uncharacterized protein